MKMAAKLQGPCQGTIATLQRAAFDGLRLMLRCRRRIPRLRNRGRAGIPPPSPTKYCQVPGWTVRLYTLPKAHHPGLSGPGFRIWGLRSGLWVGGSRNLPALIVR